MSQENVEIVRHVYEAGARRDEPAVRALYDPDVEWDASRIPESILGGGAVIRGYQGLQDWFGELAEVMENIHTGYEELIDAGGASVVSVAVWGGRGRASGIEVGSSGRGGVWTIRDGKIVKVVWFASVDEALKAVGLRE